MLEHKARVDEVERARLEGGRGPAAALTRNSHAADASFSRRACSTIPSEMSTPTTVSKRSPSARVSRPTPQPKSRARSRRAGRPSRPAAARTAAISASPLAKNSSRSQPPPLRPGDVSTAQSASASARRSQSSCGGQGSPHRARRNTRPSRCDDAPEREGWAMPARQLRIQLATIGPRGMARLAWRNRFRPRLQAYEVCRPLVERTTRARDRRPFRDLRAHRPVAALPALRPARQLRLRRRHDLARRRRPRERRSRTTTIGRPAGGSSETRTSLDGIDDASYDVVLASHTLEHIANPLRALSEWRRVVGK